MVRIVSFFRLGVDNRVDTLSWCGVWKMCVSFIQNTVGRWLWLFAVQRSDKCVSLLCRISDYVCICKKVCARHLTCCHPYELWHYDCKQSMLYFLCQFHQLNLLPMLWLLSHCRAVEYKLYAHNMWTTTDSCCIAIRVGGSYTSSSWNCHPWTAYRVLSCKW